MGIQKSIAEHQLVAFEELVVFADFVPLGSLKTEASESESIFVLAELFDESGTNFQIWSPRIKKFKCLEQAPAVLSHHKAGNDARGTALASERVHKHTFVPLLSFGDEAVYLIRCPILLVEQRLVLFIEPVVRQILDADVSELVADLRTAAVDDASNLVGHHKFKVTSCKAVTDEEAVFYFDGSNHFLFHHHAQWVVWWSSVGDHNPVHFVINRII